MLLVVLEDRRVQPHLDLLGPPTEEMVEPAVVDPAVVMELVALVDLVL